MQTITSTPKTMRTFSIIWFGQLVSTIGSGLTGFALGVWIYQETGSTTLFAINVLAYSLPTLLISPLAGALVDRLDRRWVMVMSDTGAGLSTLLIWLLYTGGHLEVWHIYLATAFNAAFTTFQWPAYSAATTLLVPKKHLGRAGGMVQIGEAISQLISPAVAGALFVAAGLSAIVIIDFATFGFAVLTLLAIQIPRPEKSAAGEKGRGSLLQESLFGWRYIRERKGLLGLLLYFASINFLFGMLGPVLTPMMLDMADPDIIGYSSSAIGLGMLIGTLVMSAWGGPKRRVHGILGTGVVLGLSLILLGSRPSIWVITAAGFLALLVLPVGNGSSQALWQTKTAPDVQGRVFSVRRMIAQIAQPVAILLAGPLVDNVFQPLMNEGGALAGSLGKLIGVGPSRGAGLLFIVLGLLSMVSVALAYAYPRLRLVEDELPDVVADEGPPVIDADVEAATAPAS